LPPDRIGIDMHTGTAPHLTMRWSERLAALVADIP
jgi:hypothetical protein